MVINKMFELKNIQNTDNVVDAKLRLVNDCEIFKAHFPEKPVTPGVCLIQLVQEVIERAYNINLTLSIAKNVKFISVLSPNNNPTDVEVKANYDTKTMSATALITTQQDVIAKMTLQYALNNNLY